MSLSPNYNKRRDGRVPDLIVLHYTGMKSAQAALQRLCDPQAQVSAHYMVEEGGAVHELVDPDQRAWHAGVSFWHGDRDINSASIGIEIVNPGHEFGYQAFPSEQMDAVAALCQDLMRRYDIVPAGVLAHSDVAPARKQDPGELFDWAWLATRGAGLWPQVTDEDQKMAQGLVGDDDRIRALLSSLGYDPEVDFADVVRAFQRHYNPQCVVQGKGAVLDMTGAARLLALVRQIQALSE